jgi:hypothetical protein
MQRTYTVPRSPLNVVVITAMLFVAIFLGGVAGYVARSLQVEMSVPSTISKIAAPFVDPVTGYLAGSADDQRLLATLKEAGYEGGGTVVRATIDPLTGHSSGSAEDQRILQMLRQSGYEGGGTIVKRGYALSKQ